MTKKVLFISYSHDSDDHKKWVKKFAEDLEQLGAFEILLDQNLPKGSSLPRFMEQGLAIADKVLVIGTPQYKQKSESGKGAAFEGSIIGTDLMQRIDTTKYYPILRFGSFEQSFPTILQGRIGDDISDDAKYDEMVKAIADSITNEKPFPKVLSEKQIERVLNHHSEAKTNLSHGIENAKGELEEMLYNAENNLSIIKELMRKIDEEIPYLDGEHCIMASMRIEAYIDNLSQLLPSIKDYVFEADDIVFANETYNVVAPVWRKYMANLDKLQKTKQIEQIISSTIEKIKWKINRYNKTRI